MRSLLFVPGDSGRKLARGLASGADVLLVDLEDSVVPAAKGAAREQARAFLQAAREGGPKIYVRVNSLATGLTDDDLAAVMPGRPDGIMLPKSASGRDVQHLSAKLAVHEALVGLESGVTRIIAIATETAASMFGLGTYASASQRLAGLTWGAEDLSADLGAETSRDGEGALTCPYALARSLTLFGAAAAGVAAIDTVFVDFRNAAGLARECEEARRDGFSGKMAIHPGQVAVINAAFTPSEAALAQACRVVAAFEAQPGAGVIGLDGVMLDRPHLVRAKRVLGRG